MEEAVAAIDDRGGSGTLPAELLLSILTLSAASYSTSHARNVCLVSRSVYSHCWPSLHRIVALRNAKDLKSFSEDIHRPGCSTDLRLRQRQDSLRFLYLNNNKDSKGIKDLQTDERPEMWMISILLVARKLEVMHIEEYWTISYPWESQEEKPLLAYPLVLLSNFPAALHAAFVASPNSNWVKRLFPTRDPPTLDIYEDIEALQLNAERDRVRLLPQPRDVTLSALAMSSNHLSEPSQSNGSLPPTANLGAFDQLARLHLYFAKMDPVLVEVLATLPRLTHIRLTRPFSEHLSEAVFRLLGGQTGDSQIECLIVEAGIYMDQMTLAKLRELRASPIGRGKLFFIDNLTFHHGPYKPPEEETVTEAEHGSGGTSSSTSTHVINWVTSSEQRGFTQFAHRAWGAEGVWSTEG